MRFIGLIRFIGFMGFIRLIGFMGPYRVLRVGFGVSDTCRRSLPRRWAAWRRGCGAAAPPASDPGRPPKLSGEVTDRGFGL